MWKSDKAKKVVGMSVLKVLSYPNPRLRVVARAVEVFDDKLSRLVDDMFETMYHMHGIGLAATQVDEHRQVIVMDVSENKEEPLCLINPRLVSKTGTETMTEGCLSVPGFHAEVSRARQVVVEASDRNGDPLTLEADDLLAVCIQHEMDHLQGKLFVDYLSPLRRQRFLKELKKAKPVSRSASGRQAYLNQWREQASNTQSTNTPAINASADTKAGAG